MNVVFLFPRYGWVDSIPVYYTRSMPMHAYIVHSKKLYPDQFAYFFLYDFLLLPSNYFNFLDSIIA